MISVLTCPVCGQQVLLEGNRALPFCSERCRLVDLNRWLEEEIGLPVEVEADWEDEEEASPPWRTTNDDG
jgi:endogenous inhibitor of DNA gyrase (YacG/DUF329 family)